MEVIDWSPDWGNSISSSTGRLVVDGVRAAEVRPEASSKGQIAALLDLLDLHYTGADAGSPVVPDRLMLRIPNPTSEARGAIGTLLQALGEPPLVTVLERVDDEDWAPVDLGWDLSDDLEYPGWGSLLAQPRPVPALVSDTVQRVGSPSLRAYPMLSTKDRWSLRVEGLEVARVKDAMMNLGVGKDGKLGGQSLQRKAWIEATGLVGPVTTGDADEASQAISSFIAHWRLPGADSQVQDEHALESRILRGACPVQIDGKPLTQLKSDAVVNWGSQFPTKWGPGGRARYLDALLRDGATPWAIEMKVQGAGGVGQYYRHAVAQAVLYRDFIRGAAPLHSWFTDQGLNAQACQAAVVVPELPATQTQWRERLTGLCEAFQVVLVEVNPAHAWRHPGVQ